MDGLCPHCTDLTLFNKSFKLLSRLRLANRCIQLIPSSRQLETSLTRRQTGESDPDPRSAKQRIAKLLDLPRRVLPWCPGRRRRPEATCLPKLVRGLLRSQFPMGANSPLRVGHSQHWPNEVLFKGAHAGAASGRVVGWSGDPNAPSFPWREAVCPGGRLGNPASPPLARTNVRSLLPSVGLRIVCPCRASRTARTP